jgi:hypothetical protein
MTADQGKPIIGVVGPCKSGKTLLKHGLTELGFEVKHIAQEHSFVSDMWQKIAQPDVLVYLDVSFPVTLQRSSLTWNEGEYQEQLRRLNHAHKNADLYIQTDNLTPGQVLDRVIKFLSSRNPD